MTVDELGRTSAAEAIRFEGDVRNQHARYKLPLLCAIGDKVYKVVEWSVAGVSVERGSAKFRDGQRFTIKLVFPFDGYEFLLDVDVVAHPGTEVGQAEFQYVNLTPAQLRLLRYVLDSYLAGEILTAGEVLDLNRRAVEAPPSRPARSAPPGKRRSLGELLTQSVRIAMVIAITLGLIAFVAASINYRVSEVPVESATVAVPGATIFAPETGLITELTSGEVREGGPVGAILTSEGTSITLFSPCDCTLDVGATVVGKGVKAGDALYTSHEDDARPFLVAWVPRGHVLDLYQGVSVRARSFDGTEIPDVRLATLPVINSSELSNSDLVQITLELSSEPSSLEPGQPVVVQIFRDDAFGLRDLWNHSRELFEGAVEAATNWFANLSDDGRRPAK